MQAPNVSRHPEPHILQINGKPFVSGLYWKPLRSVRAYMSEAKELGKQEHMDMVAIRKGRTVIQAGFAPKTPHKNRLKGMYSLAAALAGQLGDNWVGVFELEDGNYALVAVYKGAIVPGFDLVGGREDIENNLREVYSLLSSDAQGDFAKDGKVIAPADFQFGNESADLGALLVAKALRNDYRLRPLTWGLTPRELVAVGVGATALIAAGVGVSWWLDEQAAAEARALALAAAQAELSQQAQVQDGLVRPWTTLPPAQVLLAACRSHLDNTPLSVGGWLFSDARCAPGKAIATYRRNDSTPVATFVAAAHATTGAAPALFEQGATGTIEAAIEVSVRGSDELPNTAQLLTDFTSHIQGLGPNVTLSVTEKPFTPDPEDPEAPIPDWTTNGFTVQSAIPPQLVFAGASTAGIRVLEVTTTLSPDTAELAWTVTGELYGR